jgi:hypothetical protein
MSDVEVPANEIERWRVLAKDFRESARKTGNLESRRLIERYAADYERRIERAEAEALKRPDP